jgi:hypothetical protein
MILTQRQIKVEGIKVDLQMTKKKELIFGKLFKFDKKELSAVKIWAKVKMD